MKLIGYWMENLLDTHLPLPQELVGEMSDSVRDGVCRYLTAGKIFETYRGTSWCRFHCGIDHLAMGCRELTDGEWVWPDELVHYVREHSVVLPDEFIVLATSGKMAANPRDHDSVSLDFWVQWARQRQSATICLRLAEALAAAKAAEPAAIDRLVQEVLARETEGADRCIFLACTKRALIGRRICARHFLGDHEIHMRTHELYRLPVEILA